MNLKFNVLAILEMKYFTQNQVLHFEVILWITPGKLISVHLELANN